MKTLQVKERILHYGAESASLRELVRLVAGVTAAQADLVLPVEPSNEITCAQLRQVSLEELREVGLAAEAAAKLLAALELGRRVFLAPPDERSVVDNPRAVAQLLGAELAFASQEQFAVLLLDVKNRLITHRIVSVGTLDETLAHPREVFKEAVRHSAAAVIVAHNHPSGNLEASPTDLRLTSQLIECGKTLQIPVLDHVIVGRGNFVSLRRTTDLWRVN